MRGLVLVLAFLATAGCNDSGQVAAERNALAEKENALAEKEAQLAKREMELRSLAGELERKAAIAYSRQPFLEDLAVSAAQILVVHGPPVFEYEPDRYWEREAKTREYWFQECLRALDERGVVLIESDEEFRNKAVDTMQAYFARKIGIERASQIPGDIRGYLLKGPAVRAPR